MLKAYQGYFKNGRFMPLEKVEIPENVEVFVTVTGRELPQVKSKSEQQRKAMEEFLAAISQIHDEPITDDDIARLENNRVKIEWKDLDL